MKARQLHRRPAKRKWDIFIRLGLRTELDCFGVRRGYLGSFYQAWNGPQLPPSAAQALELANGWRTTYWRLLIAEGAATRRAL